MTTGGRAKRLVVAAPRLLASGFAGASLPLMVLLLAGRLYWPVALPLALAAGIVAAFICGSANEPGDRIDVVATLIAAGACVVWAVVNSFYSAEDLYAHRDPTTYNLAARWLMDHPSLRIATHPELFGTPAGYIDKSAGFGNASAGHVYAQGNHLLPVLLAAAGKSFGVGGLLKANVAFAAVGLFVLFGLARRLVGPIWALVVMTTLAVSLPLLYVARDTLSEPLALVFLLGGLLLLHRAIELGRIRDFALAGLIAGSASVVRIDADAALLAFVVVAVFVLARAPVGERRRAAAQAGALLVALAVPVWLGWADVAWLSNGYYHDERTHILLQLEAGGALIVVGAIAACVCWRPPVRDWLSAESTRYRAATVASWVIMVSFVFLATRPLWLVAHGGGLDLYLEQVQRQAGNAIDISRTYSEQSVSWQALYFGWPTVVFAVIGYVLLVRRLARSRDYALLGFLVVGLAMSALYLWTPEITPDQVYASRRYVPVIMPALLIAAAYALRLAVARFRRVARLVVLAVAIAMVGLPAAITAPAFGVREEVPQLAQVRAVCAAVGSTGAIVEVDDSTQYSYEQTFRSYCNAPSLGLPGATASALATVRAALSANGRTLYVVGATSKALGLDGETPPFSSVRMTRWPSTLHTTPRGPAYETVNVYLGSVAADGTVQEVPTARP